MEIYIEGLGIEKIDILIDIANTENVALKVETEFREWVTRGVIPAIMYTNFPILNEHKNLPDDLQKSIASVISKNIELERKLLSIELDKAYANSLKARRFKYAQEIQILKIVGQERDISPNNFWGPAKSKSSEYLKPINERESRKLGLQSTKVFSQYIDRILKRHAKMHSPKEPE
ncbi:hypothetical protein [Polynucleobacter sp. MWH-Aus1W21]|uniref:hypothetical protein n=1 Tax=Polynucleobacter sp. MWH-Aus1W21 TaxID=1855880 RepID=UPI001BFE6BDF|nr:hypothetical protein [Polynucleobacter sp. MWH-Aus1W21]QWD67157.1 hypothetical protein ICW03_04980 [Polynucleobacter sp. MWH-Aus1W21]